MKTVFCFLVCVCAAVGGYAAEGIVPVGAETAVIGDAQVASGARDKAKKLGIEDVIDRAAQTLATEFGAAVSAKKVFVLADRKVGGRYTLIPQIDGLDEQSQQLRFNELGVQTTEHAVVLAASARIVDTKTGESISDIQSIKVTKNGKSTMEGIGDAGGGFDETVFAAAQEAAQRLAQEVIVRLYPDKAASESSIAKPSDAKRKEPADITPGSSEKPITWGGR